MTVLDLAQNDTQRDAFPGPVIQVPPGSPLLLTPLGTANECISYQYITKDLLHITGFVAIAGDIMNLPDSRELRASLDPSDTTYYPGGTVTNRTGAYLIIRYTAPSLLTTTNTATWFMINTLIPLEPEA